MWLKGCTSMLSGLHAVVIDLKDLEKRLGDIIVASVKKAMPGSELKTGTIIKGVIVRVKKNTRRKDGTYIRFDHNALVVLDADGNPRGTRIFGAVGRELREKNFLKIVSLAQDVV